MKRIIAFLLFTAFLLTAGCSLQSGPEQQSNPANDIQTAIPAGETNDLAMGMGFAQTPEADAFHSLSIRSGVSADGATLDGIDVSVYQGTINWTSVKNAGKMFAFARLSYGSASVDTCFKANWAGMKTVGLFRGAYQFFRPSQDALAQANLFLTTLGALGSGDLNPVLDVEVMEGIDGATVVAKIKTWCDRVRSATGRTPIVYTSPYFWDALPNTASIGSIQLWIAHWGVTNPSIPSLWTRWEFHQYSSTGSVSGISGAVDLDRFNGDINRLRTFAGGSTSVGGIPKTTTEQDGIPGAIFWMRMQLWAKLYGGYTGPLDGVMGVNSWKGIQVNLTREYGYTGACDGVPGVNTYKAMQRWAARYGYTGPIDGALGPNSYKAIAKALNTL